MGICYCESWILSKNSTLEGGLEPPTLWLTATRSNQLSYSSMPLELTLLKKGFLKIIYTLLSQFCYYKSGGARLQGPNTVATEPLVVVDLGFIGHPLGPS